MVLPTLCEAIKANHFLFTLFPPVDAAYPACRLYKQSPTHPSGGGLCFVVLCSQDGPTILRMAIASKWRQENS